MDLAIQDGKIAEIGVALEGKAIHDADNLYLLPGGVDPHVHLDMPAGSTRSSDDWSSGTKAALLGGTTTVIDFIEPEPEQSLEEAWFERQTAAEQDTLIDFGLHMTIDPDHLSSLDELGDLVSKGLPSYKLYTTYAGFKLEDQEMLEAMRAVRKAGGMVLVHSESDAIVATATEKLVAEGHMDPASHPLSRPAKAEEEAVERVLSLAGESAVPVYIVHISTRGGADAVRAAAASGQHAWGETCPQYLLLDESLYRLDGFEGAKYVCSPPLRTIEHATALWEGLARGTIHSIGTDHCPFFYQGQKELGRDDFRKIPGGLPGIQSRLELMYTFGVGSGKFDLQTWVDLCSSNPAKIFGLYPRKGSLAVGSDADIVLFDPERSRTITVDGLSENVDYTPYQGMDLKGSVTACFCRGRLVVNDGSIVEEIPGRFLPRYLSKEML